MTDPNAFVDEAYDLNNMVIGEEGDASGWTLLPEGIYIYTITKKEIEQYEPTENSKLPKCWKVTITMAARNAAGDEGIVSDNFFCTKKQAWKIKNLFVSAGLIKREEKEFSPNWDALVGHDGVVEIAVREYKDRNGNVRETNDIKKYFDPEDGQKALFGEQESSAPAQASAATTTPAPAPIQSGFSFPGQQ